MKRRRPHWEREELIQLFVLGMIAANPKLSDGLETTAFTGNWSEGLAAFQEAIAGKDTRKLNDWLENQLGVKRVNGDKVVDAALERLRQDAAFRDARKVDELGAWQARVMAEMRDRRRSE